MDLRYPMGPFKQEGEWTTQLIDTWIKDIEQAPYLLRQAVQGLSDDQLNTPYRPKGWTLRQVVHHLPDSHLNSYLRMKLALTEESPIIKPYQEEKWAELPDSQMSIELSLSLFEALHKRWVALLHTLRIDDLNKTFIHPDSGIIQVGLCIGIYAWHGQHHIAHITSLRDRLGW